MIWINSLDRINATKEPDHKYFRPGQCSEAANVPIITLGDDVYLIFKTSDSQIRSIACTSCCHVSSAAIGGSSLGRPPLAESSVLGLATTPGSLAPHTGAQGQALGWCGADLGLI